MWCLPNLLVLILGLIVIAILVGVGRWALAKFHVEPFIVNIAYVIVVIAVALGVLNAFCLFDNLSAGHRVH
jgi:hypothetical protein